jgi:hypothetical protein
MAELGFEVVLRPDVRLLIDRLDESIEDEVYELNQKIARRSREVDYSNASKSLTNDIQSILSDVLPTRYGNVELVECHAGVVEDRGNIYVTGVVKFNTPNYVFHRSTKEDVSSKLASNVVKWFMGRVEFREIIQELINSEQTFGYRIMSGYQILESEAFITRGEL